jgi:hypothetical protein
MPRAKCTTPGYVYLIRSKQKSPHGNTYLYKIGCSRDPHKRFKAVRSGPNPLTLIAICPTWDMYGMEKRLHDMFAHKRIDYEWFGLSDRDLSKFNRATVQSVTAIPHDAPAPALSKSPQETPPIVLRKRLV